MKKIKEARNNFEFSQMSKKDRDNEKYNQMYAKFMIGMTDEYLKNDDKRIKYIIKWLR